MALPSRYSWIWKMHSPRSDSCTLRTSNPRFIFISWLSLYSCPASKPHLDSTIDYILEMRILYSIYDCKSIMDHFFLPRHEWYCAIDDMLHLFMRYYPFYFLFGSGLTCIYFFIVLPQYVTDFSIICKSDVEFLNLCMPIYKLIKIDENYQ